MAATKTAMLVRSELWFWSSILILLSLIIHAESQLTIFNLNQTSFSSLSSLFNVTKLETNGTASEFDGGSHLIADPRNPFDDYPFPITSPPDDISHLTHGSSNESALRIVYSHRIPFRAPSGALASFDTVISFQILTTSDNSGEGMAFFVAEDPTFPLNSFSGYLGLSNDTFNETSNPVGHRFLAVEFDIFQQYDLDDPSDDHVGINVNSMRSLTTSSLESTDLSLRQNHTFIAEISFSGSTNIVEVRLRSSEINDSNSNASRAVQLRRAITPSDVFEESMFVGITWMSGSGESTSTDPSIYRLFSWKFAASDISQSSTSGAPESSPTAAGANNHTAPLFSNSTSNMHSSSMGADHDYSDSGFVAHTRRKSAYVIKMAIGISLPSLCAVAIIVVIGVLMYQKRHLHGRNSDLYASHEPGSISNFSYGCLKKATGNFSEKALLGEGGFSKVYKGKLPHDGSPVAIKKLKGSSVMEKREVSSFASEVRIISGIRHRNLLQLRGWCYERRRGKALLVYQYAENGSLDKPLYGKNTAEKAKVLPSERRLRILVGVATALEYLHEGLGECVLHRDVKAANVLLNGEWEALLGDFGLARLVSHDRMGATMTAAGTAGYIAPEVVFTGRATEKADVYSFGILLLEMACGRRVLDASLPAEEMNLLEWVWFLVQSGRLTDAVDPAMFVAQEDDVQEEDMAKWKGVMHLALICCHPQMESRPSMRQARQVLVEGTLVGLPATRPAPSYGWPSVLAEERQNMRGDACTSSGSKWRSSSSSSTFG